jgi:hypothetical protein
MLCWTLPHVSGSLQRNANGGSSIVVGGNADVASGAMRRLSNSLKSDDDSDQAGDTNITIGHHGGSGFGHFVAGVLVIGLLFAAWRTISRNGGIAGLRRKFPNNAAPAVPTHPGVLALCDLLATLERRLAKVETHVTSREFDLNRKFREIDAGRGGNRV